MIARCPTLPACAATTARLIPITGLDRNAFAVQAGKCNRFRPDTALRRFVRTLIGDKVTGPARYGNRDTPQHPFLFNAPTMGVIARPFELGTPKLAAPLKTQRLLMARDGRRHFAAWWRATDSPRDRDIDQQRQVIRAPHVGRVRAVAVASFVNTWSMAISGCASPPGYVGANTTPACSAASR